jgi:hypothetical protein
LWIENGDEGGRSTISIGTVAIACHGHWPRRARKHFVNTRLALTPPSDRM